MSDSTIFTVIGFCVFLLILIALREVVCWYYKINERIALQKETIRLLKKLAGEPEAEVKKEIKHPLG